jgi:hypothetical protein
MHSPLETDHRLEGKVTMSESDWNAEAEAMALHVAENLSPVPRGVLSGRQSRVSVVFGNDRELDPLAAQQEVSRIRDALEQAGIRVLGFGVVPDDDLTWAMIVESEDVALLNELVGPE